MMSYQKRLKQEKPEPFTSQIQKIKQGNTRLKNLITTDGNIKSLYSKYFAI